MSEYVQTLWPAATAVATLTISVVGTAHAILYKRDSRAAIAWVGLIWLVPVLGAVLYVLLGINRIRRRVSGRRGYEGRLLPGEALYACTPADLTAALPAMMPPGSTAGVVHLEEMARLCGSLTGLDLLRGNSVEPLFDGDEAYPAMLEAIDAAQTSVTLSVYIFDNDTVGQRFLEALSTAVRRGVHVSVLVDAVGARYSIPTIASRLRNRGVRTALFMSSLLIWRTQYMNLRNHRKILVVDGVIGFCGGMNIRACHLLGERPAHPTRDTHFRLRGPIVQQLQATFVEDWHFTTGERLQDERWFPAPQIDAGPVFARAIPDGPDHDLDRMSMAFQGALAVARRSVRIVTPYFLPDRALIAALNTCALRGVTVDIVLPQENNLRMVAWAAMAQMWQVLEWGCRVWMTPAPFDHSKLMVVDNTLSIIGSSNWDPRSLRLNFELGLECYDPGLAGLLGERIDERLRTARIITFDEVNRRPLPVKLRDGIIRLAAPYL